MYLRSGNCLLWHQADQVLQDGQGHRWHPWDHWHQQVHAHQGHPVLERIKQGHVTQSVGQGGGDVSVLNPQMKDVLVLMVWRSFIDLLEMRRLNSDRLILR